jgi:hypothetical protein
VLSSVFQLDYMRRIFRCQSTRPDVLQREEIANTIGLDAERVMVRFDEKSMELIRREIWGVSIQQAKDGITGKMRGIYIGLGQREEAREIHRQNQRVCVRERKLNHIFRKIFASN